MAHEGDVTPVTGLTPVDDDVVDAMRDDVAGTGEPTVDPGDASDEETGEPGRLARWRERARRNRATNLLWHVGVLTIGFGLVAAGIVMLVFPGPGWAAIILGLVVLASEYAWAHRLLQPVRRWATRAAQSALDPGNRRRNAIILGVVVVVVAGLAAWYVSRWGLSLDGVGPIVDTITPW